MRARVPAESRGHGAETAGRALRRTVEDRDVLPLADRKADRRAERRRRGIERPHAPALGGGIRGDVAVGLPLEDEIARGREHAAAERARRRHRPRRALLHRIPGDQRALAGIRRRVAIRIGAGSSVVGRYTRPVFGLNDCANWLCAPRPNFFEEMSLPRGAIEHVERAVLRRVQDHLARLAVDVDRGQRDVGGCCRTAVIAGRRVVVPRGSRRCPRSARPRNTPARLAAASAPRALPVPTYSRFISGS